MRSILALSIGLFIALAAGVWLYESRNPQASTTYIGQETAGASSYQRQPEAHQHAVTGRVPAYYRSPPGLNVLAPTMRPEVFAGNVRLAYQVAQEIPRTLAQLPCYCHCDRGQGHKSLHSCFVDEHGSNCGICISEALMAYRLEKQQRLNIEQIRERIIQNYGANTPVGL